MDNQNINLMSRMMMAGSFKLLRETSIIDRDGDKALEKLASIYSGDNKYISVCGDRLVMQTDDSDSLKHIYEFYKNLYGIVSMSAEEAYISPYALDNTFIFKYSFDEDLLMRLYDIEERDCSFDEFVYDIYGYFDEDSFGINAMLKAVFGEAVFMEASVENRSLYYEIGVDDRDRFGVNLRTLKLIQVMSLYILLDGSDVGEGDILEDIKKFASIYTLEVDEDIFSISHRLNKNKKTMSEILEDNYSQCYKERFKLIGYEDMELSTQILMKEAIKNGISVDVLDRSENFIALKKGEKTEYVKEATKTSVDSYISVLIMENKVVTKKVVEKAGINVPKGYEFNSMEEALREMGSLVERPIVVKPKSTNFGIGISIFPEGGSGEDIESALKIAFENDNTVMVEEFIKGKEYRFLVIDGEVRGVLNRVPANVKGDGIKTITQLTHDKNLDPLRGKGYKTPLEKINLDDNAALFLKQRNLDFNYVPKDGEIVYLRENSNISTGGDSVDYTDDMLVKFKEIAVRAAESVNARICGVDMMIEDYKDENSNYSIIELNFNPAIHIHSYPYIGKERNIALSILRLLGFTE